MTIQIDPSSGGREATSREMGNVQAMILAAGRGERLRPLTDTVPKPLLPVAGKPIIEYLVEALAQAGIKQLVINHSHLGEQIVENLGDGSRFKVNIRYSPEPKGALETGGGIYRALSYLDSDPFIVVNGDIWTDYPFEHLPRAIDGLAHLVLVENPPHHPRGDFSLHDGRVLCTGEPRLTYSGIGVYTHALFSGCHEGKFPLVPLLRQAMGREAVSGERYAGCWYDVGTAERLVDLDRVLKRHSG
jgi:N-acetyl-alpha-D-muramate 1-phosphate uridylyltransferase